MRLERARLPPATTPTPTSGLSDILCSWQALLRARIAPAGLILAACAHPGTPMHPFCRELPTVEECHAAAQEITHDDLRRCVEAQCTAIKINCNDPETKEKCREQNNIAPGTNLGYVEHSPDASPSYAQPLKEINWCEEPASRDCRAKAMVHELAHSCGWHHGQGLGVPANNGLIQCE
jgi:hypothetical protein